MIKYVCFFEQIGQKRRKICARKLGLPVTLRGEKRLNLTGEILFVIRKEVQVQTVSSVKFYGIASDHVALTSLGTSSAR